jgi:hypothetical protein
MNDQERQALQQDIDAKHDWYNKGSKLWSFAYHFLLYSSIILSAFASVIVKIDGIQNKNNITALLAGLAAIAGSLLASGGFQRKWQANRVARGRIERLLIDFEAPNAIADDIRTGLKKIMEDEDMGILGMH